MDLGVAIAWNSGFMGGNVSGLKVRPGWGLKRVKEKHYVAVLCRPGAEIAHASPELGLAPDILVDSRSLPDTVWRVTTSVGDMLFRVMANSLTAEVRLGIAANWP